MMRVEVRSEMNRQDAKDAKGEEADLRLAGLGGENIRAKGKDVTMRVPGKDLSRVTWWLRPFF